jgi:hypothetical protein
VVATTEEALIFLKERLARMAQVNRTESAEKGRTRYNDT